MTLDKATLEDRLRDAMRQRAEATPLREGDLPDPRPAAGGRHGKSRPAAVMAALAVAAAVTAFVVFAGTGESDRVATTPPAGDSGGAAPDTQAGPGSGEARPPRLLVDLPGATLTRVSESTVGPAPSPGGNHLQVYRVEGEARPLLFVEVVPASANFGFGEMNPSAERRTVNGRLAYLSRDGDRVMSLGIPSDGGGGVYLIPFGLEADEVVAAAEALSPRANAAVGLDAVRPLPRGLALVAEGDAASPGGVHVETEVRLPAGGAAQLRIQPAGPVSFESLVRDRVASGRTVEAISILDRPGFLVVYDAPTDDTTVMWQPADGWTAELRAPLNAKDMRALAAAVRQVDDAAWAAALPAAAVTAGEKASEAARLQADIPLPPGATWSDLDVKNLDPDPYQFNVAVAKHGLCEWVKELRRATSAGDDDASRRAVDAIAGAPRWTSLQEADAAGAYPEVVADIAQAMAEGRPLSPEGTPDMAQPQSPGNSVNPEAAFGCL